MKLQNYIALSKINKKLRTIWMNVRRADIASLEANRGDGLYEIHFSRGSEEFDVLSTYRELIYGHITKFYGDVKIFQRGDMIRFVFCPNFLNQDFKGIKVASFVSYKKDIASNKSNIVSVNDNVIHVNFGSK